MADPAVERQLLGGSAADRSLGNKMLEAANQFLAAVQGGNPEAWALQGMKEAPEPASLKQNLGTLALMAAAPQLGRAAGQVVKSGREALAPAFDAGRRGAIKTLGAGAALLASGGTLAKLAKTVGGAAAKVLPEGHFYDLIPKMGPDRISLDDALETARFFLKDADETHVQDYAKRIFDSHKGLQKEVGFEVWEIAPDNTPVRLHSTIDGTEKLYEAQKLADELNTIEQSTVGRQSDDYGW